jgi:fatty acid-binding protein DegV
MVEQRFALKNIAVSYIGPIIGAHTGPDVMTLCFFGSEK